MTGIRGPNAIALAVDTARTDPWPPWRWQRYDDALRISILFRA